MGETRESGSGARGLSVRTQRSGRRRRKEEKEKDVLRRPAVLSTSTDEETTRVCERKAFVRGRYFQLSLRYPLEETENEETERESSRERVIKPKWFCLCV